jgi:adenylyltransferase/sulfurtransferase
MDNFYKRQISLPFVGSAGQSKFGNTKVLIVGAGGLGHPVALYLAGTGIGTIGILDFDRVESSNLHRQIAFTPQDLKKSKAEILSNVIKKQNPLIFVSSYNYYLDLQNCESLFNKDSSIYPTIRFMISEIKRI